MTIASPSGTFEDVWRDLNDLVVAKRQGTWLYRGHADATWELRPKVGRRTPLSTRASRNHYSKKAERQIFQEFWSHPINQNGSSLASFVELMALGQHYGLPTRLLDWSTNIMVAAYFACHDDSLDHRDGAIIIAAARQEKLKNSFAETQNIWTRLRAGTVSALPPYFLRVPELDYRIQQQQGVFSIHPNPWATWDLSKTGLALDRPFIIPASAKPEMRTALQSLGYHGGRLMRDFDRICSEIDKKYRGT